VEKREQEETFLLLNKTFLVEAKYEKIIILCWHGSTHNNLIPNSQEQWIVFMYLKMFFI